MMKNEDVIEIDDEPEFDYGVKVRSRKNIRNDGTYPGAEIGEILVRKGDVGYVNSIGTFLQKYYIYGVDFVDTGKLVGMRRTELEVMD